MLVFGDLETLEPARAGLERCAARFRTALDEPPGAARHGALINAYIETSRIAQGCADAQFSAEGRDDLTPLHASAVAALRAMARVVARSWRSEFQHCGPFDGGALANLIALAPHARVRARIAEGFAFYALFPESCLEAPVAQGEARVVIGVRSIGMALAPLLAEALDAHLCLTLRPTGHPFARMCKLSPQLADLLRSHRDARFCVIDEGPGLSGSSFGSVADALEEIGVPRASIDFFPSHPGARGAAASTNHRERWSAARRRVLDSTPAITRALRACKVQRDMSGGLWRDGHAQQQAPSNRPYERRKVLVEDANGQWLMTFSGLGDIGEHKVRLAHTLSEAGFTPGTGSSGHGFLAQRWIANARPVDAAPRAAIIARLASYIAFRARACAALPTGGASVEQLHAMAVCNITEGLGTEAAAALVRFAPRLERLAAMERRIASDNRLHVWEWLCDAKGEILKCDAVDHCAAHDLTGCRDAAWDVAGAIVEFAMSGRERADLLAGIEANGVEIREPLLDFFLPAYCAFQLGAATMAAAANGEWPQDALRWRKERDRYAAAFHALSGARSSSRARSRSDGEPRRALPR